MTARIIAARRTAVIPRGGAFRGLGVEGLSAPVIAALLADAGLAPDQVDEVILSNAIGLGGNPARRVALAAGLPDHVAGLTIDRQCAGGLDAIGLAAALVAAGQARVVIAGGAESYSQRPERRRAGADAPYDQAPFTPWPDRDPDMAQAAAELAADLGLSRAVMDDWAIASHARAIAADHSAEIVPVLGQSRDSFARALTPALAARAPVLAGAISAANTAVAADAAGFVLVVAPDMAPHAPRIGPVITRGGVPWQPGTAPIAAIADALARANLSPARLSVVEMMEAYAAQAIACIQGAGLNPAVVNLGGGALARGHPIGASGAILAVRLWHELKRRPGAGLAAIAAAGGIGTAMVLTVARD